MPWKFNTYVSPNGRKDVQKHINNAKGAVVEALKVRLRYLANTPQSDWHEPQAKKLQGVEGIYEIRFKAESKQQRPLGFFGPGPGDFTILIWAEEKQNIYKPSDAIETASKRRKAISSGQANYSPLEIDGEEFPPS